MPGSGRLNEEGMSLRPDQCTHRLQCDIPTFGPLQSGTKLPDLVHVRQKFEQARSIVMVMIKDSESVWGLAKIHPTSHQTTVIQGIYIPATTPLLPSTVQNGRTLKSEMDH